MSEVAAGVARASKATAERQDADAVEVLTLAVHERTLAQVMGGLSAADQLRVREWLAVAQAEGLPEADLPGFRAGLYAAVRILHG